MSTGRGRHESGLALQKREALSLFFFFFFFEELGGNTERSGRPALERGGQLTLMTAAWPQIGRMTSKKNIRISKHSGFVGKRDRQTDRLTNRSSFSWFCFAIFHVGKSIREFKEGKLWKSVFYPWLAVLILNTQKERGVYGLLKACWSRGLM